MLVLALWVANEVGFRVGRHFHTSETEIQRSVGNSLKASIFGLVALLLGFSFSATSNRYELRQRVVLDQANAVGTCYQRAGLLDDTSRDRIQEILRRYLQTRVDQYREGDSPSAFAKYQGLVNDTLAQLWSTIEDVNRQYPDMVRNSHIVPAANEVIDLSSTRTWANRNHLPDPVLLLLLMCVVISGVLLGHSSGQSGRRHIGLWIASNLLFGLVLFIVLDFDRPQTGLIRVDPGPLGEVRDQIGLPASTP